MKKFYFIAILSMLVITSELFAQSEYGPWKTANCFKHIQYQIKKSEYPGKWYIRFKNNYNENVTMSVSVKGNIGTKSDGGRMTVYTDQPRSMWYYVDKNTTYISFNISKVKFGDTSYGEPYAKCDY